MKLLVLLILFIVFNCLCFSKEIKIDTGEYKLELRKYYSNKCKEKPLVGQEFYSELKRREKIIQQTLNNILIPARLRKNLRLKFRCRKAIKLAAVYTYKF